MAALPPSASGEDWLACHGSPTDDTAYLLAEVGPTGVVRRSDAAIAASLGASERPVVFCGHPHVPRIVQLGDGRSIVNPGSVGPPARTDDRPYPHRMECGSPPARYAIVETTRHLSTVEIVTVEYDWTAAAAIARAAGFVAWANALRTGRA